MALPWVVTGVCLQLCMSLYPGSICFIYFLHWLARAVSLVSVRIMTSGMSSLSSCPSAGRDVDIPSKPLTFQVISLKRGAGVVWMWEGGVGVGVGGWAGLVWALISVSLVWVGVSGAAEVVGRKVWRRVCFFLGRRVCCVGGGVV